MKAIKWFLINGLFGFAIYMGFVEQHEGAYNLAMFLSWFVIIVSFFMMADQVIEKMKKQGRSVPAWISISFDISVTITIIWFGAWVTGAFYLLHALIHEAAWKKATED